MAGRNLRRILSAWSLLALLALPTGAEGFRLKGPARLRLAINLVGPNDLWTGSAHRPERFWNPAAPRFDAELSPFSDPPLRFDRHPIIRLASLFAGPATFAEYGSFRFRFAILLE